MILLFQERGGDASLDILKILATFRRDSAIEFTDSVSLNAYSGKCFYRSLNISSNGACNTYVTTMKAENNNSLT